MIFGFNFSGYDNIDRGTGLSFVMRNFTGNGNDFDITESLAMEEWYLEENKKSEDTQNKIFYFFVSYQ